MYQCMFMCIPVYDGQEKGEEDRGEESAVGQEERGRGIRCKEWQQMHNPLAETIERE